ncbi:Glycosyl transferase, group 2 family protein [plant metagenome]|uniref:Glycosyl transferase, group 2 family protein n=1 Tax=plant metagenome TaxID=1297885 RepID=A0A484R5A2_9ZZZZ
MPAIAVVIPCYKVVNHIVDVIGRIGPEVARIYAVDDCCPEKSGDFIEQHITDPRVRVLRHQTNLGVGGAVMTGYAAALEDGMEVAVKVDGDGQMNPALIPHFIRPIVEGEADYTKGNRFFDIDSLSQMPRSRLFGNACLSFLNKLSSGYWHVFDPTNGYTAIHCSVLAKLPLQKISKRYFFETDMLFRLNTIRAAVVDIGMDARYDAEISNLKISKVIPEFAAKHLRNCLKRIFYNYYLRDLSLASFQLPLGIAMTSFGVLYGGYHWMQSSSQNVLSPSGTVTLSAVSIILGVQFLLAFLAQDIAAVPNRPLSRYVDRSKDGDI